MEAMIDIETTGLDPENTAILQIAAVAFDPVTQEIDATNIFQKSLTVPPNRFWDEGTREWWLRDKAELLQKICSTAEPYEQVMRELYTWARAQGSPNFWSKPSHFDFQFIASYYRMIGMQNPFYFRNTVDCRSFVRGLYTHSGKEPLNEHSMDFVSGEEHEALADVWHQINWVMEAVKDSKNYEVLD